MRKILAAAAAMALALPAHADDGAAVTVVPVTFPAPFLEAGAKAGDGPLDNVIEASAVEPIGDGRLALVAHDKKVPLRVVEVASGKQVGPPITSPAFPAETPKSSKWEGMAADADGNFYVVGSHSGKTDDERTQHEKLVRFRLKADTPGESPVAIDDASVMSWRIAGPLLRALQHEGLPAASLAERKIEGLTIREQAGPDGRARRELAVGLRQPDDLVRVFAAEITTPPSPDAELPLTRLFAFDPGRREGVRCQLTSLEYLPAWRGFLVVTATEDAANAFHGNALWFVPDARIAAAGGEPAPIVADRLWTFEAAQKAEGLCILPTPPGAPGTARVLVTFDNDPHATHIPSRFQVVDLVRKP
ncbi:hypothetical protein OJF2_76210 [Aquisphaera giovannonii]|uniref:Phytase-like domain-containing protein n=1 Tax=Aquisphaera giovannonii TaxID=406548 RepID=A0A5B9WFG6_9BACT|nr:hypothetical protein [Aquisphaera giovannonii]QEH39009.1 hypothetical protein OJF2_76210 [Aquisphaera giovannonii]